MRSTIQEIRNQLAAAVAYIEAFIDGKFNPTPDRLNCVLQALLKIDLLINELRPTASLESKTTMESVETAAPPVIVARGKRSI